MWPTSARPGRGLAGNVGDMFAGMPGWRDLEMGAPQIARRGMARLNATRVAMLGTVRRDGSPRISPVEPCLANGCLLVGAMAWSGKAADLRRDPRYVLHSAISGADSGEGELKLHGRAALADPVLRSAATSGWWTGQPPNRAVVFVLGIDQALFVEWDTDHGGMTVHRWSAQDGYSHGTRSYP
ncbi:MAG TPA: pyridoxamine 5'-phosphate oxidase family protein [Streptosporangiaceae bacterium]|nr:pyridoxamine 5'-phosphate oxidase family protein [Streptosporangiaceae bacterium]